MKPVISSTIAFLLIMALCWYSGADLTERSTENASMVMLAVAVSAGAYAMAKISELNK